MVDRGGVSKNWFPTFQKSTQFYQSYYEPKPVTTTQYLVELMGNSGSFSYYFSCSFSVFTYLFTSGNYPIIYYKLLSG